MLGDKLVELKVVDSVSKTTIHRRLKKNDIQAVDGEAFRIPPEHSGAFVQAMEDVLEVYHLPYDPRRPVVCFDETSKQLVDHVRAPIAPRRGIPARVDDEYRRLRHGEHLFSDRAAGWTRSPRGDRAPGSSGIAAAFLRTYPTTFYPSAAKIILVSDKPQHPQRGVLL